jgi:hypothetical protein
MPLTRALLLAAASVILGLVILVVWFFLFFALSERDSQATWALYHIMHFAWVILIFGGLAAFVIIALTMAVRWLIHN